MSETQLQLGGRREQVSDRPTRKKKIVPLTQYTCPSGARCDPLCLYDKPYFSSICRCLKGDNESCRCEDPLEPQSRGEFRGWARAQVSNTEFVNTLIAAGAGTPDIAFLGGSIVEAMGGKWFGRANEDDDNLKSLKRMFDRNFDKAGLDAVSLGIAGDSVRVIGRQHDWDSDSLSLTLSPIPFVA